MGDLTNEELAELRHLHAIATDRANGSMARADAQAKVSDLMTWNGFDGGDGILPELLDMAERCAKAEKAAGELLRACTTAQRILAEYGEDNREIDEAIARAQSGQPAQRDDDKCEKPDQCEGGHDVPGIAFSGDDVWLCKECLEACDSIESRGGQP